MRFLDVMLIPPSPQRGNQNGQPFSGNAQNKIQEIFSKSHRYNHYFIKLVKYLLLY